MCQDWQRSMPTVTVPAARPVGQEVGIINLSLNLTHFFNVFF